MYDSAYADPLGYTREPQEPNPQDEYLEKIARERYEYCLALAGMFRGKHGKKVMDVWLKQVVEQSCWSPDMAATKGDKAAIYTAFAREGQCAFIRDIEHCIELAHSCKDFEQFCEHLNAAGVGNFNEP